MLDRVYWYIIHQISSFPFFFSLYFSEFWFKKIEKYDLQIEELNNTNNDLHEYNNQKNLITNISEKSTHNIIVALSSLFSF